MLLHRRRQHDRGAGCAAGAQLRDEGFQIRDRGDKHFHNEGPAAGDVMALANFGPALGQSPLHLPASAPKWFRSALDAMGEFGYYSRDKA